MQGLWANWMKVWCWGVFAFGVVLATAAVPPADGLVRTLYTLFSGGGENAAAFETNAMRFGLGLQGALTMGWALTMLAAIRTGAPIWGELTVAVLIWYVIDSAISVATGFALNAVSNTVLTVAFLIPVLASGVLQAKV
ncbi:MAG: hypothetical protein H7124_16970 [Phycisphaerales bacterium]|nr:hypothetical protein [Hyphomonadaceae bacterium]